MIFLSSWPGLDSVETILERDHLLSQNHNYCGLHPPDIGRSESFLTLSLRLVTSMQASSKYFTLRIARANTSICLGLA